MENGKWKMENFYNTKLFFASSSSEVVVCMSKVVVCIAASSRSSKAECTPSSCCRYWFYSQLAVFKPEFRTLQYWVQKLLEKDRGLGAFYAFGFSFYSFQFSKERYPSYSYSRRCKNNLPWSTHSF